MYCLTELLVLTAAQYTTFFVGSFFVGGRFFFILTAVLFLRMCGVGMDFFVVAFCNWGYISCATVAKFYIVSMEIFSSEAVIREMFASEI